MRTGTLGCRNGGTLRGLANLVADVLGFSRIVANLDHNQLDERLEIWINLLNEIRIEAGVQNAQLISDTVFVREDDSAGGLQRLLKYSKILLERSLANYFPNSWRNHQRRSHLGRFDIRKGVKSCPRTRATTRVDWHRVRVEPAKRTVVMGPSLLLSSAAKDWFLSA